MGWRWGEGELSQGRLPDDGGLRGNGRKEEVGGGRGGERGEGWRELLTDVLRHESFPEVNKIEGGQVDISSSVTRTSISCYHRESRLCNGALTRLQCKRLLNSQRLKGSI